ncbi:MAG: hypothetical protein IH892_11965 [Planctomycetes bacterium]|nr:hypothetical protein [Planctomycetota bacterium]
MQTKLILSCLLATTLTASASNQPNIVVILTDDPAESKNLIDENPAKTREIEKLYNHWIDQMAPPASG